MADEIWHYFVKEIIFKKFSKLDCVWSNFFPTILDKIRSVSKKKFSGISSIFLLEINFKIVAEKI